MHKRLYFNNLDTSETTMSNMFYNCIGLASLDVSNFDTTNVTDMSYMFNSCNNLKNLNLNNLDITKVETTTDMLNGLNSEITITVMDEANKTLVESLLTNGGTVVTA